MCTHEPLVQRFSAAFGSHVYGSCTVAPDRLKQVNVLTSASNVERDQISSPRKRNTHNGAFQYNSENASLPFS
nr:hypothetical protein BgiMline_028792 [Biomphalaria glabrata]